MKKLLKAFIPLVDIILIVFIYPSAWLLKMVRRVGVERLPFCKNALFRVGVFPINNHYYEPQFDNRNANPDFSTDRNLSGIDWDIDGQLDMLNRLIYADELMDIPQSKPNTLGFYLDNGTFESGDAEYWYQMVRTVKPNKIYEIGSGNSTLMAIEAIHKNSSEDPNYKCEHICIEPYERDWLEDSGVSSVVRKKVEEIELSFFSKLEKNDILFIDSSHIIRPQGDVLFEYLELLPTLNRGVIVHVHDIFSPKNYPKEWLADKVKFWNEQYLLEAFLSHNSSWKIIGAVNYLHHNYYDRLHDIAPFLTDKHEPGSFYIQKID